MNASGRYESMACEKIRLLGFLNIGYDSDAGTLCKVKTNPPGTVPVGNAANQSRKRLVSNADGNGWLTVRYDGAIAGDEGGSTYPPLPQYLKIEIQKTTEDREYFKIMEGRQQSKTASVRKKTDGGSYLQPDTSIHTKGATVRYNISKGKLEFNGKAIDAKTDNANPTPAGIWKLDIPYEVHNLGARYLSDSRFATTWFRIASEAHDGVKDRFLHPGSVSLGCTTVTDVSMWTELYEYLIKSRSDTLHVGTIEIVEK